MLTPYRTAAKPPKAHATPPNRALAHVVRWLPAYAVLVSTLAPAAFLPGHQTADATCLVLAYVFATALTGLALGASWAPPWPWPRIQQQVVVSLLLSAIAVFVATGLYWGPPNTSLYAPLPTARVILPTRRAEYIRLPYGTYIGIFPRIGPTRSSATRGSTMTRRSCTAYHIGGSCRCVCGCVASIDPSAPSLLALRGSEARSPSP